MEQLLRMAPTATAMGPLALIAFDQLRERTGCAITTSRFIDTRFSPTTGRVPPPLFAESQGTAGRPRQAGHNRAICWVIAYLIEEGADPNAMDKSGVAPLHRAVRTRSSYAVRALIENGANPPLMNNNGSTPLHLAVQNTGKGNSG